MSKYPVLGYLKFGVKSNAGSSNWRFHLSSFQPDLYRRMIELLIAARKDAGITQAELGKRIKQRQTFVSKFETGERRLDVAEFVAVCEAVGSDPVVLFNVAIADLPPH